VAGTFVNDITPSKSVAWLPVYGNSRTTYVEEELHPPHPMQNQTAVSSHTSPPKSESTHTCARTENSREGVPLETSAFQSAPPFPCKAFRP